MSSKNVRKRAQSKRHTLGDDINETKEIKPFTNLAREKKQENNLLRNLFFQNKFPCSIFSSDKRR